ncbi:HEAT repeat domain-containing protein [Streptomyces sp. NPDC057740]|uniref:HEAT repeat domain-containing protein n=1 Tax=Streptomyces sp. NPDC057740 TaxID=3346234 RepID=UPI00368F1CA7
MMSEPGYRTHRYVLHPDKNWSHVADLAEELGWPLVHQQPRDQSQGLDGQMIWQSDGGVSVHYVVDVTAGIGYITLAGPDADVVSPFASRAVAALSPWRLDELFQRFDEETDPVERGRLALRLGLAAPPEATNGCIERIEEVLSDKDARVRLAGLWAVTYTGYEEFVDVVQRMAQEDPESMIRARAESIVTAFSVAGGEE